MNIPSLLVYLIWNLPGIKSSDDDTDQHNAINYLAQFGYMGKQNPNPAMASLQDPDVYTTALKNFQIFAGLPATGLLDNETMEWMAMPRCGVRDILTISDNTDVKRKKRFALQGSKWRNNKITYRITQYTSDLTRQQIDEEVARSFRLWSDVSSLKFTQKYSGTPDIEILFTRGDHGDESAFDGRDGTLAHAYFPEFGGDAHFDDDEIFTINSSKKHVIDVFKVVSHELGHSLGLSHSKVKPALMAPFYRRPVPDFKLHKDDIDGIRTLYPLQKQQDEKDPAKPGSVPPEPGSGSSNPKAKCKIGNIDAAVYIAKNDRVYLFSGNLYWRLNSKGIDPDYPKEVAGAWGGVPGYLDAAFNLADDTMYFFKGTRFWRWSNYKMAEGYPKTIGYDRKFVGLAGVTIDAAFVWSGNGRIYFISGDKYYRLSKTTYLKPLPEDQKVDAGYPRRLSLWRGLPSRVGAALHNRNGRTYFFARNILQYYRFNDRKFSVDLGYPRNTTKWWLWCEVGSLTGSEGGEVADLKVVPNQNSNEPLPHDAVASANMIQSSVGMFIITSFLVIEMCL